MFIEFGTWNYKLFIILFPPIGNFILICLNVPNSTFNNNFLMYLGFLSSGIIYLIILFRSRSKSKNEILVYAEKGSAISQIDEQQKEEKKRKE